MSHFADKKVEAQKSSLTSVPGYTRKVAEVSCWSPCPSYSSCLLVAHKLEGRGKDCMTFNPLVVPVVVPGHP